MSAPKILLYLHHVELGQRYPVSESEVIIGRSSGDILFSKDERLSAKHCRIAYDTETSQLMIQDLGSSNGTLVDGRILSPQKKYPIRDGTMISVGNQVFRCVELSKPRVIEMMRQQKKKKRKKRRKSAFPDLTPIFFLMMVAAAGWLIMQVKPVAWFGLIERVKPAVQSLSLTPLKSPFEMVYKEVQEANAEYTRVGSDFQSGKLNDKQLSEEIRNNLIPRFTAVQTKLKVLRPGSELERRRIEANLKLVTLLLAQVKAMAGFADTKNPKYSKELDEISKQLEAASAEARRLNERQPAASGAN